MSDLVCLDDDVATDVDVVGAKAAALARARAAGLPALPGYVLPVAAGSPAMRIGRAALAERGVARRAVAATEVDAALTAQLRTAVERLGGRVIVRSSSPFEGDARWSGAFSSMNEIGTGDIGTAVRGCWASAFAPDPLARLERCGLPLAALGLGVLIQPELRPTAGGTALVAPDGVRITGVRGHPGPLLAGWADGAGGAELAELVGDATVIGVAELARAVYTAIGCDVIEWAADPGIHLLQCARSASTHAAAAITADTFGFLTEARVHGTQCVPGHAIGRLVYVRPHETTCGPGAERHILVCDRPLPAFAPLLFGAGAVVTVGGGTDSHLAGVARSLGVPMLVRTPLADVTGSLDAINTEPGWLAAIDAARGELAVRRGGR